MNNLLKYMKRVSVFVLAVVLSSCAVVKATNQPGKKDMTVLEKGTERARVVAELGKPIESNVQNGQRQDIFKFVQGYSTANKTLRALGHGAADVYTLGLWEVVGTPIEGANTGTEVQVSVNYNRQDRVSQVKILKGANAVYKRKTR